MQRLLLLALAPALAAQHDRFGQPACPGPDLEFAHHSFFALCHSPSRKVSLWVGHELRSLPRESSIARPRHFRRDVSLAGPAAHNSDYLRSGLVRGHMAPAADFAWSSEALRATFVLSNTVPQRSVNFGRWAQLEAVRRLAASADRVYVFTGPIFDSPQVETIGPGRVAVPTHTYKVVLAITGAERRMYAAIVPNSDGVTAPLDEFAVAMDEVERRTGLDFFDALDDAEEDRLEAQGSPLPAARPQSTRQSLSAVR